MCKSVHVRTCKLCYGTGICVFGCECGIVYTWYVYACVRVHVCVHVCACVRVHVRVYACVHVCAHVCVCI